MSRGWKKQEIIEGFGTYPLFYKADSLAALAAGESPQRRTGFTCFYGHADNIVFPASTATLAGADNRFLDGLAHVQMALHPEVMAACLTEIGRD